MSQQRSFHTNSIKLCIMPRIISHGHIETTDTCVPSGYKEREVSVVTIDIPYHTHAHMEGAGNQQT